MKHENSVNKAIKDFFKVFEDFVKKLIAAGNPISERKLSLPGKLLMLLLILPPGINAYSQSYTISGYNGQTVTTCSGTFYDSGAVPSLIMGIMKTTHLLSVQATASR